LPWPVPLLPFLRPVDSLILERTRQRHLVPGLRNLAMSGPIIGDDDLCRGAAASPIPGIVIQPGHRLGERGQLGVDGGQHPGDVGVDRIDPVQHRGQQVRVMISEPEPTALRNSRTTSTDNLITIFSPETHSPDRGIRD
jgi:hypothetical protein